MRILGFCKANMSVARMGFMRSSHGLWTLTHCPLVPTSCRLLSTSTPRTYASSSAPSLTDTQRAAIAAKKFLKNEEIPFPSVQVIDPETRSLGAPTSLRHLLSQIDKKTHFYQLITATPFPLVKLVSKSEAHERKMEEKRLKRERMLNTPELKEIQMTWGVEKGDLKHKLAKVQKELKGKNVVNVILAKKKGANLPPPADREKLVQDILDALQEDAKERRARTVTKVFTVLYFAPVGSAAESS